MFIQRPDAQLHTLSFGQGSLTLLAIGGWTAGGEIWHAVFGHLADWRCVSVDHRGAGASMRSGPITVDAMADDLHALRVPLRMTIAPKNVRALSQGRLVPAPKCRH